MTEKELIKLGYIPKELPPPFESITFSDKIDIINTAWNKKFSSLSKPRKQTYKESKWVAFSIPKVNLARRILNIPNPLHQSKLCKTIVDKWIEIQAIYAKSKISSSYPIEDTKKIRALVTKESFGEFKSRRLNESFDNLYEVKTDISRFYGTIYTHSIPWLVHTKATAKANRDNFNLLGNALDRDLRNSNSGQTVGIPIGPDTSLIIAEIITCMMDEQIQNKLKNVKTFRFIDDYYLYCDSYADAEKAFKFMQSLLTEFQLDINEDKTLISKSPFAFDSKWSIELGKFTFREKAKTQLTDIERFVSLSLIHSNQNPKDSVLLFSIQVLRHIELFDTNWGTYESLVLKIAITEPRTLPVVTEILASNKHRISKDKIKCIIEKIIKINLPKGHNYEVAWALWLCVEFKIKLKNKMAEEIFASNDTISILIALDLKSQNLINTSLSTKSLLSELTPESLLNENWLLTYESIKKGWLTPLINPIDSNEYFKILLANGVYFYNALARVKTFMINNPEDKIPASSKENEPEITKRIIYSGGGGGGSY